VALAVSAIHKQDGASPGPSAASSASLLMGSPACATQPSPLLRVRPASVTLAGMVGGPFGGAAHPVAPIAATQPVNQALLMPSWRVADSPCAWWMTSPLGTPRGRYDEYSS
jgi:hypothetical protein